jgi:hypothetical protein
MMQAWGLLFPLLTRVLNGGYGFTALGQAQSEATNYTFHQCRQVLNTARLEDNMTTDGNYSRKVDSVRRYAPLSNEDKQALFHIAIRDVMTLEQYARKRGIGQRTARHHVDRWRYHRCAKIIQWAKGESSAIAVTSLGRSIVELPPRWKILANKYIEHAVSTNEVEIFLRQREDMVIYQWWTEKQVEHDWQMTHPNMSQKGVHFPDSRMLVYAPTHFPKTNGQALVNIEVQRTLPYNLEEIDKKIAHHTANGDPLWFFSPKYDHKSKRVYDIVESRFKQFPPHIQELLGIWNLDRIISRARITQPLPPLD